MSPSPPPSDPDITALLRAYKGGEPESFDRLMAAAYPELKRIARLKLWGARSGETISPTVLVNEAYLRLAGADHDWHDRVHFLSAMSRVMRHVLVDYARSKQAAKRRHDAVPAGDEPADPDSDSEMLVSIGYALTRLERSHETQARVFECRYFGGMSTDETAAAVGLSKRTVERQWQQAKSYLAQHFDTSDAQG